MEEKRIPRGLGAAILLLLAAVLVVLNADFFDPSSELPDRARNETGHSTTRSPATTRNQGDRVVLPRPENGVAKLRITFRWVGERPRDLKAWLTPAKLTVYGSKDGAVVSLFHVPIEGRLRLETPVPDKAVGHERYSFAVDGLGGQEQTAQGQRPTGLYCLPVGDVATLDREIELLLTDPVGLVGTVVDPLGKPVKGAEVWMAWPTAEGKWHEGWGRSLGMTDSSGAYRNRSIRTFLRQEFWILAAHPKFLTGAIRCEIKPGTNSYQFKPVRLRRGIRLRGLLLDMSGRPLRDAGIEVVSLESPLPFVTPKTFHAMPPAETAIASYLRRWGYKTQKSWCNARGEFSATVAPNTEVHLWADGGGDHIGDWRSTSLGELYVHPYSKQKSSNAGPACVCLPMPSGEIKVVLHADRLDSVLLVMTGRVIGKQPLPKVVWITLHRKGQLDLAFDATLRKNGRFRLQYQIARKELGEGELHATLEVGKSKHPQRFGPYRLVRGAPSLLVKNMTVRMPE